MKEWNTVTRFCSIKCRRKWMSKTFYGKKILNWKGGTVSINGYKVISIKGKRMYKHRYIMEKHLDRKLKLFENVHHINGNKLDNRLKNLIVMIKSKHSQHHYPKGSKFGINSSE